MPTLSFAGRRGALVRFAPVTGADLAAAIGPGLAKAALLVEVDGELRDLSRPIEADAAVRVITARDTDALEVIRHDAAHLLAEAGQGALPRRPGDDRPGHRGRLLLRLRPRRALHARRPRADRGPHGRDQGARRDRGPRGMGARRRGEDVRGHGRALQGGADRRDSRRRAHHPLPPGAASSISAAAPTCPPPARSAPSSSSRSPAPTGGAMPATRCCSASTARPGRTTSSSRAYLHRLEEAEKRDHRRLGREMGLFHFQEEAPGAAFWHPKGWTLFRTLVDYMRARQDRAGYREVSTPRHDGQRALGGLGPLADLPRAHVHPRRPRTAGTTRSSR